MKPKLALEELFEISLAELFTAAASIVAMPTKETVATFIFAISPETPKHYSEAKLNRVSFV